MLEEIDCGVELIDLTRPISFRDALAYAEAMDSRGFFQALTEECDCEIDFEPDLNNAMEAYIQENRGDILAWLDT